MRLDFFRTIRFVGGVIPVLFIIYFLMENSNLFQCVSHITFSLILMILSFHLLNSLLQTFIGWILYKRKIVFFPFMTYYWINAFSMFCNYIPLQVGLVVRGVLQAKKLRVSPTLYLSVLIFVIVTGQAWYAGIASVTIGVLKIDGLCQLFFLLLAFVFFLPFFSCVRKPFYVLLFVRFFSKININAGRGERGSGAAQLRGKMSSYFVRFQNFIREVWKYLIFYYQDSTSFLCTSILMFLNLTFIVLRYYLINIYLGFGFCFGECLLLGGISAMTTFYRITPADMGIREGLSGIASKYLDHSSSQGIVIVLVDRILSLGIVVPLGIIGWKMLEEKEGALVASENDN